MPDASTLSDQEPRAIEVRTEHYGGNKDAYLVGEWPERTIFAGALLRDLDSQFAAFDGETVTLTLTNTSAQYRITRYDWQMDRYEAALLALAASTPAEPEEKDRRHQAVANAPQTSVETDESLEGDA